jgi:RHS repeat-associated protein
VCLSTLWRARGYAHLLAAGAYTDPQQPYIWFGTLLHDKENSTGTHYRRNRVLNPTTGRFTQEDPIGLAGGINLYGFASGDPVNFGDPFGDTVRVIGVGARRLVSKLLASDTTFRRIYGELDRDGRNYDFVSADEVSTDETWNMRSVGLGPWRGYSWYNPAIERACGLATLGFRTITTRSSLVGIGLGCPS